MLTLNTPNGILWRFFSSFSLVFIILGSQPLISNEVDEYTPLPPSSSLECWRFHQEEKATQNRRKWKNTTNKTHMTNINETYESVWRCKINVVNVQIVYRWRFFPLVVLHMSISLLKGFRGVVKKKNSPTTKFWYMMSYKLNAMCPPKDKQKIHVLYPYQTHI